MALFRKLFYRKPPDGLFEICERVYVFDCCFTTNALQEENYKDNIAGIVDKLKEHFPEASFLAFDFHEGAAQSQIAEVLSEFDMTIMEYPHQYEGCLLLTVEVIHHFLRSAESWLSLGQQNLLLMHCESGSWPILAFMLAALLIYRKQHTGEQKTLDMIYRQAPRELLHSFSSLNHVPSQLRYLQYVSRRNLASEWPPLDRALTLDCVILRCIPNFDGAGGCRPLFRVYGLDPFQVSDRTTKILYSTKNKGKTIRLYKQAECELAKIDINCHIQGDVVLECVSLHDEMEHEDMMFQVLFNTAFIRSNILIVNREEIDMLWDAKGHFPKDFRAEILFSEMDAAASVVPVEFSVLEEKEGLPVEAFAKVHEIFSSVDWLDPKTDAALNLLQQITTTTIVHGKSQKHFRSDLEQSSLRQETIHKEPKDIKEQSISGTSLVSRVRKFEHAHSLISSSQMAEHEEPKDASYQRLAISTGQEPAEIKVVSIAPSTPPVPPPNRPANIYAAIEVPQLQGPHSHQIGSSRDDPFFDGKKEELLDGRTQLADSPQAAPESASTSMCTPRVCPLPPPVPVMKETSAEKVGSQTPSSPPTPLLKGPSSYTIGSPMPPPSLTLPASSKGAFAFTGLPKPPSSTPSCKGSCIADHPLMPPLREKDAVKIGMSPPPPPPPPPQSRSTFPSPATPSLAPLLPSQSMSLESPTISSPMTPPALAPPLAPPPHFRLAESPTLFPMRPSPPPSSHSGPTQSPTISSRMIPSPPPPPSPLHFRSVESQTVSSPMTPPLPPPPSLHSRSTEILIVSSSKAPLLTPLPPPPPPPPTPTHSRLVESRTISSPMTLPPPPPPPSHSRSAESPTVSSPMTAQPPPPPMLSSNLFRIPSAPLPSVPSIPPPVPFGNGILNSNNGDNNMVSGSPTPPLTPPTSTKGRLSRTISSRSNQTKKLKPLHWLKLTRAMQGSLWAEAQKSGEVSKAPEINMSELESLFSAVVSNRDNHGGKLSDPGLRGSKVEKVQLIDHRRAYNCEIMLSKVKVLLHELVSSMLTLEESALDVDQVENLIKFCPTKEEIELLKGYTGDNNKLGKCEQFFLELMKVPRVESKLRIFSFKMQFNSQVSDLRNNLNIVNNASEEIRNSTKLKRIMQTILSLGNALNQGTARGSAVGFKLDSLLKLNETRARNNKMTLLHYLCKVLADQLPEVLDFSKDLTNLEPSSKIQLKFLAEEMQAISKGLEKVVQELALSESDGPVSEDFCKILKQFLCSAEAEVRSLTSLYSGVGKSVDGLILYFGEDPARCPFEQVVSTLLNFVRLFKKAHEDNCKQLEMEMKKSADGSNPKTVLPQKKSAGMLSA